MAEPLKVPPGLPSDSAEPVPWQTPRPNAHLQRWQKPVFILFLLAAAQQIVVAILRIPIGDGWRWTEGLFLLLATATTLLALGRRLPLQNVVMSAFLIAAMSIGLSLVGTLSGIPFGPYVYADALGDRILKVVPWPIPLVWIVFVVNSRGIARLIMRPWRKTNYYGFWVIGLSCLLTVVLDLGLEPFAVYKGYWAWRTAAWVPHWYSAPWVNFLGWFVAALAILAFTTPWLINKQPVKQSMDYQPLITWLLIAAVFIAENAAHHLWLAAATVLGGAIAAAIFAIRGAVW